MLLKYDVKGDREKVKIHVFVPEFAPYVAANYQGKYYYFAELCYAHEIGELNNDCKWLSNEINRYDCVQKKCE